MYRWLELLLLGAVIACAVSPTLARCDTRPRGEPSCPQDRAMEDFAYLLAQEETPIECTSGDTVRP